MRYKITFPNIFFFVILFSTSLAWGRFYVGVEGGYMRDRSIYIYEDNSGETTTGREENWEKELIGNGVAISLILGTEHFFGKNRYGIRWGILGSYGITQSKNSHWGNVALSTLGLGVNSDFIFNFYIKDELTSGVFAGIEYDFTLLKPNREISIGERATNTLPKKDMLVSNKTHINNLSVRFGFSTLLKNHHRLEILAKIPFYLQQHSQHFVMQGQIWNGAKDDRKYTFKYQYFQILLGYKYVF